jgi:predicted lipid-binding transport protein (Tim44 family)
MLSPVDSRSRATKERSMKSLILALSLAVMTAGLAPTTADAKRIGSGSSSGMQRSLPARTPPPAAPAQPAQATPTAPPTAGAAAAAAAPKRSWMGPLAGLAAGLGLAALMSHLGMGAEFGNIIMLVLMALLAFVAIRFVMSHFARGGSSGPSMATPNGLQFAGGAPQPAASGGTWSAPAAAAALAVPAAAAAASTLPAGFDAAAFERIAKMIFIRMQTANDGADLNDLRNFTTPEMFAAIKLDLQDRGSAAQTTDVVRIDAEVLDVATEPERQLVSVRFHGLIREEKDGVAAPFDEVWHLVKPTDGSREWAIAGIQQTA